MESNPPERLFSWFHTPRGYATLLAVAAVLVAVGLVRESPAPIAETGPFVWLLLAGVGVMLVVGVVGAVAPNSLGIEPKETWRVVLLLLAIAILALPILLSIAL